MMITPEEQAKHAIENAKRILVVTRVDASIDAAASVAALLAFLEKQQKHVDGIVPGWDAATSPKYLAAGPQLRPTIGAMRSFEIALDVSRTPLSELLYDVKDGILHITVVPTNGEWTPKDVSFSHGADRYDLVIAVDCPDKNSLGPLFHEHADFFYRTPVICIDRDPSHEHWGHINIIDMTAVATTEVLTTLFDIWNTHLVDENIATALLAGMIAKTQSFRTTNVTPKTLTTAANLVTRGARREEIVHALWRTRSVPMLKLWGRALSRLEMDRNLGIVWATLSRQDFIEAGAHDNALDGVVSELVSYTPEAKIVVLIYETQESHAKGACVAIHVTHPYSAQDLGRAFGATGTRDQVHFCLTPGTSLVDGTKMVIEKIQETLKATK